MASTSGIHVCSLEPNETVYRSSRFTPSGATVGIATRKSDGVWTSEMDRVLRASPTFEGIRPLLVITDHQPPLPGGGSPGQSDLWMMARTDRDLVSIAIEENVGESFGRSVREWLDDTSTTGKKDRLDYFATMLELPVTRLYGLRYRLVLRTVSALVEAARFNAAHAMLLIHSVSKDRGHFEDYRSYVGLFDESPEPDTVISAEARSGIALHFAWVTGLSAAQWIKTDEPAGGIVFHSLRSIPAVPA